jgi:hypothetical protein
MFVLSRNANRNNTNRGGRTRRSHLRSNFFSATGSMFVPWVSLIVSSLSPEGSVVVLAIIKMAVSDCLVTDRL